MYILSIIRTKALILAKKLRAIREKKVSLAVTQNIRTKCLGYPFLKLKEQKSRAWLSLILSLAVHVCRLVLPSQKRECKKR